VQAVGVIYVIAIVVGEERRWEVRKKQKKDGGWEFSIENGVIVDAVEVVG
jgi:hypothetical protein